MVSSALSWVWIEMTMTGRPDRRLAWMSVTKWPRQRGLVIVPRRGSYDDGATWTPVPAEFDGDTVVATVDNRPAAGGYVSVEVELTDAHGVAVTQTIQRLYSVS
jgi:hypothetical protein